MNKDQTPLPASQTVINVDDGLRRFGGNWDTLCHFIHRFIELHEGLEQRAWQLYHEEDFAALGKLAHKLKGAAGNLSAMRLRESARQLENALIQKSSYGEIEALISTIAEQLEEVRNLAKSL